jgi:hypothetical protein
MNPQGGGLELDPWTIEDVAAVVAGAARLESIESALWFIAWAAWVWIGMELFRDFHQRKPVSFTEGSGRW